MTNVHWQKGPFESSFPIFFEIVVHLNANYLIKFAFFFCSYIHASHTLHNQITCSVVWLITEYSNKYDLRAQLIHIKTLKLILKRPRFICLYINTFLYTLLLKYFFVRCLYYTSWFSNLAAHIFPFSSFTPIKHPLHLWIIMHQDLQAVFPPKSVRIHYTSIHFLSLLYNFVYNIHYTHLLFWLQHN